LGPQNTADPWPTLRKQASEVAAARVRNGLPQHVTSVQSLTVFRCRLKNISSGAASRDYVVVPKK